MFDFCGLGQVKRDRIRTAPRLSKGTLRVSIQIYRVNDKIKQLLLFIFDSSIDREMALEMSNVIASRFADTMISPPALPDASHMQSLLKTAIGITQKDYVFTSNGQDARIQMLIIPIATQEVSHA